MKPKHTIPEILARQDELEAQFDRASLKEDKRTVEVAFSSELPVSRWYGMEILSHTRGAVNFERLKSGRANLLVNHDPGDWVGIIEEARVDEDRVGRAVVRFGNSPRAQEIFRDVKDGILASVSVGYRRDEMKLTKTGENETDEYTVTRWTPLEVSLVTVPADHTVGVGRAADSSHQPAAAAARKEKHMDAPGNNPAGGAAAVAVDTKDPKDTREASLKVQDNQALVLERSRIAAIKNLCKANKIDTKVEEHWIGSGLSLEDVTENLLKIIQERAENVRPVSFLGLSEMEKGKFSLFRAVIAAEARDWTKAPFEKECVHEVAKRLDKVPDPKTFYVPYDILQRTIPVPRNYLTRDMTVGTAAQGGYLVGTENIGFIEMLRNRSVAFRMGARRLSGLVGNVTIPRQSGAATAGWLANEAATITESNQTLQQVALSPKTVGAYTEVSRQLMLQSNPSAEGIVTADLAAVAGLAVDTGVLNGSGASGQPTGIINTSGVGSVTGTSLAFDDILEFQTDVAGANVMPVAGGYATTPAVASLCIQRVKYASTASPLWEGSIWDGMMQGFPAMSSLQVPTATMLFGDWSQVIVGEWGNLEVTVNPYANFVGLLIGIRAVVTIDVALRYAGAFSIASSIT